MSSHLLTDGCQDEKDFKEGARHASTMQHLHQKEHYGAKDVKCLQAISFFCNVIMMRINSEGKLDTFTITNFCHLLKMKEVSWDQRCQVITFFCKVVKMRINSVGKLDTSTIILFCNVLKMKGKPWSQRCQAIAFFCNVIKMRRNSQGKLDTLVITIFCNVVKIKENTRIEILRNIIFCNIQRQDERKEDMVSKKTNSINTNRPITPNS